jgi:antitoxin MazE
MYIRGDGPMQTKIQRWGNSLGLRIPKSFASEAHVEAGSAVDLSVEDGRLIVRPLASPRRYDLKSLVAAIKPHNVHDAIDWGDARGREAW